MPIKSIKSKQDLQNALMRADELWESEPNTPYEDELDALVTIIEAYELNLINDESSRIDV
ncbi:hypothetical protein LCGC14_1785740 [marine sediment metagenome]|uniref:HTH cro/C1-type domain-containing protein n=1 Tax=marine sediment metagenome TaxID=412755 RepID=A0A0F9GU31_9ZZZZ